MLPVVSLNDPTDVSRVQHAGDTVSGVLTLLECANDEDLHWATSRHLPAGPQPHFRRAVADRGSARRVGGGRSLVVHIGASEPLVVPGHATSLPRRRHGEDSEDNQQCQEEQEGQPVGHRTSSGRRSVGANRRTRPATWSHHPVYVRVFGRDGRLGDQAGRGVWLADIRPRRFQAAGVLGPRDEVHAGPSAEASQSGRWQRPQVGEDVGHGWMWRHGAWEVRPPDGGWGTLGARTGSIQRSAADGPGKRPPW